MELGNLLLQLARAVVLSGGLCRGDKIDSSPECVRVTGHAQCTLPGDLAIEADALAIQWREGAPAFHVMANGNAIVRRGEEAFSADDARVIVDHPETKPRVTRIDFAFRPAGLRDPFCE
jgi:hypothetical protein